MTKKNFIAIILLLAISLASILYVQFNWISDLNQLNEDRFKKDVQDVLYVINQRLEEKEIINLTKDNLQAKFKIRRSNEMGGIELIESTFNKKTITSDESTPSENALQFDIEAGNINDSEVKSEINASIMIEDIEDFTVDSAIQNQINKVLDRSEMIQIILNKLLTNDRSIKSEFDANLLEKIIEVSLIKKNIDIDYEFLIFNKETNEILLSNSNNPKVLNSEFSINLFQNDLIDSNLDLYIYFPGQDQYIGENNFYSLMFSVLFIILIVACFYYVFLKLFELNKLSDIKNDFIDNMTHELKTPISTISLACEVLLDKDVKSGNSREKYLGIINQENKRLGGQVERVLDIAKTEKDNYKLELKKINIHTIIEDSFSIIKFKVEKRGGKIISNLNAKNSHINGNEHHLLNVFNNLLDNANKYSLDKPIIIVESNNKKDSLEVNIIDNGLGIKKSNLDKIFDKFYRESQGNIHNVKGFGLGLSYVKNILKKHKATIAVESSINKGSKFKVIFKTYNEK